MKKLNPFVIFILYLLFAELNYAQRFNCSISGTVLDEATKTPLVGVNVFISETVWGTSTDGKGNFVIKNLPHGNHEIIASIIGFEVGSFTILLKDGEKKTHTFYLKEKAYELETVEVQSERPVNWDNHLAVFKKLFIGQSDFSEYCFILNEEQLSFERGAANELFASSGKQLQIHNEALGYEIEIILMSFTWNEREGRLQYTVKPQFKELEPKDEVQKNLWNSNRQKAYLGSINHFMKAVKGNKIKNENYRIYFVPRLNRNQEFVVTAGAAEIENSWELMKKSPFPGEHILTFGDRLAVEYDREDGSEILTSFIDLKYSEVTIDQYGYPEEYMPFQTIGYWAKLGIADWLPKYYGTEKQSTN
ncbi:MAG: carboxypeptidase-like regulatory domain-containing protein [Melioribacteraceae bacterium]|nr:MAG: carboxypeptidase-like regulatory domain-containing protein [Melioribacteraceae bacterium]